MLTALLPLNAAERKITRSAQIALTGSITSITPHVTTIKTGPALQSYWSSLSNWANRNLAACSVNGAEAVAAQKTGGAKTSKGKVKTRGAGA